MWARLHSIRSLTTEKRQQKRVTRHVTNRKGTTDGKCTRRLLQNCNTTDRFRSIQYFSRQLRTHYLKSQFLQNIANFRFGSTTKMNTVDITFTTNFLTCKTAQDVWYTSANVLPAHMAKDNFVMVIQCVSCLETRSQYSHKWLLQLFLARRPS